MHRELAQVEQAFAGRDDSALAHLPSGKFTANAALLTLAATSCNLTRGTVLPPPSTPGHGPAPSAAA
ncbi:hypothetical protein [Streptomyces soliscabiei]|uniref:hypothetical protein n=1 Tax=Streptomyces soliscabiei TaxID=588897 RepID=UPI00299FDAE7|nr:hypothetical protein [Streptomyces sp. NY05-11A]MDX2679632.1 hypothetical protein [Streptomyces sp. NY05-11A]